MCEVVNNRDGFYPGGRGNGTSELNLVPCTSCVEKKIHPPQVLHHICQSAAESALRFSADLGEWCPDCLTAKMPR